ncbi:MAG TPA: PIN domain-containing protein [Terriglobia bacterium]|jgi:predicted nucleic acid-binding protein
MKRNVILDTGPLVALIDRADHHHDWSVSEWDDIQPPMLTCESVISEACFLLDQIQGSGPVFEMLSRNTIEVAFRLQDHLKLLRTLIRKYANLPMSVADACLVRMAEQIPNSSVFTLDSDFKLYRKHGRQVIPLICPGLR